MVAESRGALSGENSMNVVHMLPPEDGSRNAISFAGRLYSSAPGVATPVPKFDVPILAANGWTIAPSSMLPSTTSSYQNGVVSGVVINPNGSPAGIAVRLYIDGSSNPAGVTVADANGNWSVQIGAVSTGAHSFSVEVDASTGMFTVESAVLAGLIMNLDLSIGVMFPAWL